MLRSWWTRSPTKNVAVRQNTRKRAHGDVVVRRRCQSGNLLCMDILEGVSDGARRALAKIACADAFEGANVKSVSGGRHGRYFGVPAAATAAHKHAQITKIAAARCFSGFNARRGCSGDACAGEPHAYAGLRHHELPPPVDRPRARVDAHGPARRAQGLRARVLRKHFMRRTAPARTRNRTPVML